MDSVTLVVVAAGGMAGFASGFLGVGGAILLIPSLLIGPSLVGAPPLGIHEASGLTAASVAGASIAAGISHRRSGHLEARLAATTGSSMLAAGFVGAAISRLLPPVGLLAIFASMATLASLLLLVRYRETSRGDTLRPGRPFTELTIGATVGVAAGMVGAGGAFLLVPAINRLADIPLRVAIGTMPAVALLGTGGTLAGKFVSGQVPMELVPWAIAAAAPAAILGARLSHRANVHTLRMVLAWLATLIAAGSWIGVADGIFPS